MTAVSLQAQDDGFYSYYNDSQITACSDLSIIREMKGGTVITVDFDGNWNEDMKGAFRYACKIWEENLPTMLPIRIKASIGTVRGNSLSKVVTQRLIDDIPYLAPQARLVILKEYNRRHNSQFISLQDSLNMCNPDMCITYNKNLFNTTNISFSLSSASTTKIDFVTQALRDIAVGLGFCTHFVPSNNQLELPDTMVYSGLEKLVKSTITTTNWSTAYNMATQGSLTVSIPTYGTLTLYAPQTWIQGLSLSTFIPNSQSGISQLMTWQFGKGTVIRNIADQYDDIFKHGFDWIEAIPTGSQGSSVQTESCLNTDTIGFQGTRIFSDDSNYLLRFNKAVMNSFTAPSQQIQQRNDEELFDVSNYCKPFDPTLSTNNTVNYEGWTFSLLKKDGTWDVISQMSSYYLPFELNLSNLSFNYLDDVYARTTDNYLRGRVMHNIREWDYLYHKWVNNCRCIYIVLDYLPQQVEANVAEVYETSINQSEYSNDIDIAVSNLEGTSSLYMEQLEEGDIYPTITQITDIKSARYRATMDIEYASEFTFVSYNNNGYKRSEALIVEPLYPAELNLSVQNNKITVTYGHKNKLVSDCTYEIFHVGQQQLSAMPMDSPNRKKCINGQIDISRLEKGLNIINVSLPNGKSKSIKLIR